MRELFEKFKALLKKTENHVKEQELEPAPDASSVLNTPFVVPGFTIPRPQEMYSAYGRPPKELDAHLEYPVARLITAVDLPGKWNSASHKLYILEKMEPFLREALIRCEKLKVIDYIEKMGAYNHRHMRHDPNSPLSYHSWAAAVDINSVDNAPKYRAQSWNNERTRGPVPLPFSAEWMELYPRGMPFHLVMAFKSVGFSWGGDWGKDNWVTAVKEYGIGHSVSARDIARFGDWLSVEYVDPMHFELTRRKI